MNGLLPWHTPQWESLIARHRAGRLPHALLLAGPRGLGKDWFARLFAQALLCEHPDSSETPCGNCRGCHLFQAGTHPDLRTVSPAEEGKAIRVDQIRELTAYLTLKSQYGGYKVATITPAERMNSAAANSLLKTLEEPAANTVVMLVSTRPSALPATIRSRCQRVAFAEPARELSLQWLSGQIEGGDPELLLSLANGAPLSARALAEGEAVEHRVALFRDLADIVQGKTDPVAVAGQWHKGDIKEILHWAYTWVLDMIRLKFVPEPPRLANPDLRARLQVLADRLDLETLYRRLDAIRDAWHFLDAQANRQLLLEDLLIAWSADVSKG